MANTQLHVVYLLLCLYILDTQKADGLECRPNLKNVAVYEGQSNTTMNLLTDPQAVQWSVLPTSDEFRLQTIIDFGGAWNPSLAGLYDVEQTGLIIKNATATGDPISTAGLYVARCANDSNRVGAKLLVVRAGPQCSSNRINATYFRMSCTVTFADAVINPIRPIIAWKRNGANLVSTTLQTERNDANLQVATSTIASNRGAQDNFACELTFAEPTDIEYPWIATNAPTFKESCATKF